METPPRDRASADLSLRTSADNSVTEELASLNVVTPGLADTETTWDVTKIKVIDGEGNEIPGVSFTATPEGTLHLRYTLNL